MKLSWRKPAVLRQVHNPHLSAADIEQRLSRSAARRSQARAARRAQGASRFRALDWPWVIAGGLCALAVVLAVAAVSQKSSLNRQAANYRVQAAAAQGALSRLQADTSGTSTAPDGKAVMTSLLASASVAGKGLADAQNALVADAASGVSDSADKAKAGAFFGGTADAPGKNAVAWLPALAIDGSKPSYAWSLSAVTPDAAGLGSTPGSTVNVSTGEAESVPVTATVLWTCTDSTSGAVLAWASADFGMEAEDGAGLDPASGRVFGDVSVSMSLAGQKLVTKAQSGGVVDDGNPG